MFQKIELADGLVFHLKLEGFDSGGSIKAKSAREMLDVAIESGALNNSTKVIESSSGNLAIALSRECAKRGYDFVAVVDPNAATDALAAIQASGGEIIKVVEKDEQGGFLGTRLAEVAKRIAADPNLFWTNQYANPGNPSAHAKTTGPEIAEAFERIDRLYIGAGTCGTVTGVGRYMKQYRPETSIIAVDNKGSVTFGGPAGPRYLPGLGTSRPPGNLDHSVINHVEIISEADAVAACRWLARRRGLLLGGSTGSVVAAALRHHKRLLLNGDPVCVGISPDCGEKYLSTIFNDTWVEERFGRAPIVKGAAEELEL